MLRILFNGIGSKYSLGSRLAISWCVLVLCMGVSVLIQLALLSMRSSLQATVSPSFDGQIIAALVTALVVEAMQAVLLRVVTALVAWQNHRSESVHEWHLALQLFIVAVVNRFFSVAYLALFKPLGDVILFGETRFSHAEICRRR